MIREIHIPDKYKSILAEEFDVSMQTIRFTLKFIFNSDRSRAIRKRAVECLLKEAEQATKWELELKNA